MDRRKTYIFTHYSDITTAKERDVRNLRAEMARCIVLGVGQALLRVFYRASNTLSLRRGDVS